MKNESWICPNCQKENLSDAEFCIQICSGCGKRKNAQEETPSRPTIPRLSFVEGTRQTEPLPLAEETMESECSSSEELPEQPSPDTTTTLSTVCQTCGAFILSTDMFCGECGTRIQKKEKQNICEVCQILYPSEKKFCSRCGDPLCNFDEYKKKKENIKTPKGILKTFLLPLVALIFLIFAFLPIYKIDYRYGDNVYLPVRFSVFDNLLMSIDADFSEAEPVQLNEKIKKLEEEVVSRGIDFEEDNKLSISDKNLIAKLYKLNMRRDLSLSYLEFAIKHVIVSLFSVFYIVFALLFFFSSFLHALQIVFEKQKNANFHLRCLTFSPFLIFLTYYISKSVFLPTAKMSFNIIPLVLVCVTLLTLLIHKFLNTGTREKKTWIAKGISLGLIVLSLFAFLSGAVYFSINGTFADGTDNYTQGTLPISSFLFFDVQPERLRYLVNIGNLKTQADILSLFFNVVDIKEGTADLIITKFFLCASHLSYENEVVVFSLLFFIGFLAMILLCISGSKLLLQMLNEKQKKTHSVFTLSLFAFLLSVCNVILNYIFTTSTKEILIENSVYNINIFTCELVFLPVLLCLCIFISLFFHKKKRKSL